MESIISLLVIVIILVVCTIGALVLGQQWLISIFCIVAIVVVAIWTWWQVSLIQKQFDFKLQNLIDQINNAQYYEYTFDKKQEKNIQNLDHNIGVIESSIKNIQNNVKACCKL
jgi:hypothetical protein